MSINARQHKYIFGPVPSRRFGRSLGIDLTPFKTCSLDCIFCQLGQTTHKTLERREYVPTEKVKAELEEWSKKDGKADYITLAGSGEPTLHSNFGEIISFARDCTGLPTVLLSNGTLFRQPEVRKQAKSADIVKLSLSAWDQASFEQVNRPHSDLRFDDIVNGYRAFRNEYGKKLFIEVFLVWGTNSIQKDVEKIAAIIETIEPDEIHLNTAVRPPAEEFAFVMPRKKMEQMTDLFIPVARVISEFSSDKSYDITANEDTILAMLRRRPCTAQQIGEVFGMHLNEVSKYIGKLSRTGKIEAQNTGKEAYYVANKS
jgi:wyosine [tRNA(Phe)-imidazoG37] synthetase (radical SAM superfamily)